MTTLNHLIRQTNLIDGVWVGADDGTSFDVNAPATGEVIATVPKVLSDQFEPVSAWAMKTPLVRHKGRATR